MRVKDALSVGGFIVAYAVVRFVASSVGLDPWFIYPALPFAVSLLSFYKPHFVVPLACVAGLSEAVLVKSMFVGGMYVAQIVAGVSLIRYLDVDPIFRRKRDVMALLVVSCAVSAGTPLWAYLLGGVSIIGAANIYWIVLATMFVVSAFFLRLFVKPHLHRTFPEVLSILWLFSLLIISLIPRLFPLSIDQVAEYPFRALAYIPIFAIAIQLRPRFTTLALVLFGSFDVIGLVVHGGLGMVVPNAFELMFISIVALLISVQEEERRTSRSVALAQTQGLENALARISSEAQAREDFVAMLAHELRNPLAPLRSVLETWHLDPDRVQDRDAIAMLLGRVEAIARILNDLLETSQLARGKRVYTREPVLLNTVVQSSILSTEHYRTQKRQVLTYDSVGEEVWVLGDRIRLEQVFTNVLSNASKYSKERRPIVLSLTSDQSSAQVQVRDRGVGMSADAIGVIFEPFRQLRGAAGEGLGIGLSIAKEFVELLGGTIRAESPGIQQGTTVTVTLPRISAPARAQSVTRTPEPAQGVHILIVDDNDAAAAALGSLLDLMGFEVEYAYNAASALSVGMSKEVSAMCLDLNMPDMNGVDLGRALRARGFEGLLIALSGYARSDAEKKYGDLSMFDAYVLKPVSGEVLREILTRQSSSSRL